MVIDISVSGVDLIPSTVNVGTKGSFGINKLRFWFSEEWTGFVKRIAFFPHGDKPVIVFCYGQDIDVPSEVLKVAGNTRYVVSGLSESDSLLSVQGYLSVTETETLATQTVPVPTPSEISQIYSYFSTMIPQQNPSDTQDLLNRIISLENAIHKDGIYTEHGDVYNTEMMLSPFAAITAGEIDDRIIKLTLPFTFPFNMSEGEDYLNSYIDFRCELSLFDNGGEGSMVFYYLIGKLIFDDYGQHKLLLTANAIYPRMQNSVFSDIRYSVNINDVDEETPSYRLKLYFNASGGRSLLYVRSFIVSSDRANIDFDGEFAFDTLSGFPNDSLIPWASYGNPQFNITVNGMNLNEPYLKPFWGYGEAWLRKQLGDIGRLEGDSDTVVGTLNDIMAEIGSLDYLQTETQVNLVEAINELDGKIILNSQINTRVINICDGTIVPNSWSYFVNEPFNYQGSVEMAVADISVLPTEQEGIYQPIIGTPYQRSKYGIISVSAEIDSQSATLTFYAVNAPTETLSVSLLCLNAGGLT